MTALAVLATAVFAGLAAGAPRGALPQLRRPRRRRASALEELLRQAGSDVPASRLRILTGGAALLVVGAVVAASGIPALAVVPGVLTAALPGAVLRRRALARCRAVRQAWPDALALISGSVRSGRPLSQALVEVSVAGPDALREPLAGLATRIATIGLVPSLQAVAEAVADPATDRVVEVLCLAHSEGGGIVVEVVDDLARGIAEEVQTGEELDTLSLEGRLNARLVFAIPWLVLAVLASADGPYRAFYASPAGAVVILLGAGASLIGLALVSRLSRLPREPRVLRSGGRVGVGS